MKEQKIKTKPDPINITSHLEENQIVAYFDRGGSLITGDDPSTPYYYRKYMGKSIDGHYIIQDFYCKADKKYSDPIIISTGDLKAIFPASLQDGLVTHWYENGQRCIEGEYINGKLHSSYTRWHENGQKKSEEMYYKSQNLSDHTRHWDENGDEILAEFIDAKGNTVTVGDKVRILSVNSCMNIGLDRASKDALRTNVNSIKTVQKIDEYNWFWFEFCDGINTSTSFSLESTEILLEEKK